MIAEQIPALAGLTVEEKWLLAAELWAEVEEHQEQLPATPDIRVILEQRMMDYERDPTTALSLDEFRRLRIDISPSSDAPCGPKVLPSHSEGMGE